jgi:hypothetical protein
MRSRGRNAACLVFLFAVSSCLLNAQARSGSPKPQSKPQTTSRKASSPPPKLHSAQLVNPEQGLAILGAALATKHPGRAGADCSHLVHAIYEKAGFPYTYVPSGDLYVGTDEFRRVAEPQAGDLVVWLGHTGIVVNPREHTFYSALRSGLLVQEYDSPYWKRRGRPHFLRYVREQGVPLLTASNRSASLKPVSMKTNESRDSIPPNRSPEDADEPDELTGSPGEQPSPVPALPGIVSVETDRPRPDEVRAALVQHFDDVEESLEARDVLKLYPSLVAFESFEVKKVHVKGDEGWAEIQVKEPSLISGNGSRDKKLAKVQRWNLRRQAADVWAVVLPSDATYVPREVAVHLMAHQLASLTDANSSSTGSGDDKARLARLLNVLLAETPSR